MLRPSQQTSKFQRVYNGLSTAAFVLSIAYWQQPITLYYRDIRSTMDESPLNKLPLELRIQIYELVFYCPTQEVSDLTPSPGSGQHREILALPSTCRQIRSESMPIFAETDKVVIYRQGVVVTWHRPAKEWTRGVKVVEITFTIISRCTRVKKLVVNLAICIKKLCIDCGVHPVLKITIQWTGPTDQAPQIWKKYLQLRLDGLDRPAVQARLDDSVCKARNVSAPLQYTPLCLWIDEVVQTRALITVYHKRMSRILERFDDEPAWSWLPREATPPQENSNPRDWAQYLEAGLSTEDIPLF